MNKILQILHAYGKIKISVFVIWLVTIVGLLGIWLVHESWFLSKTPFTLMLGAGLLYWNFPVKNGWSSLAIWSLVYLIGIGVEIVGVNTGWLFGEYHYGQNLGPRIFGVPLLIGVNWTILTFLTATICKRYIRQKWLSLLIGALLMVGLDFLIEPTAPIFDFWYWSEGLAPLRNFVDWFVVSLILQVLIQKELHGGNNPYPMHHFATQVVFFAFFYVIYQF
ncbi:MAG: carotenoid biosynthesis protein [Cyclobacteriaceae bacterium]|nr:carotenoid biosynthesis protein [Cyclobacteriaceae bacterium]